MIQEELEQLLRDDETDRSERTVSTEKTDKFCEAICAFANDLPNHRRPGYLFIGARPDGTASGAQITDRLLQSLAGIRADGNIQPLPTMAVQKWALGGGEMAVIEVMPSDLPPVRYKGQVWVRVGPRRAIAQEAEERILNERRAALARTWDARPCREATLSDLALDLFATSYRPFAVARTIIDENHRSMEDQLAALRLFDLRAACPTNAAVLLLGKDPRHFFPGAYAQHVRYDGPTQAARVLRDRPFSGDLLSVMRGLDELAKDTAGSRPVPAATGLGDREVFDYPPRALHELLMNAVIHRTYESTTPIMINQFTDRLEILSPGGLYGDLTAEQFPRVTAYRNPVIAEAAKVLGFVNRFGRGIDVAQADLAHNGSPAAEFNVQINHFLVTVRTPA
jgi:ATP-dependent DNA helicase RecG